MPLSPGDRLAPYEIVSTLGQGGMGIVLRARDTKLERDVAIKVLPRNLAEDPEALGRFEREAKAVAALSHPNILAIHDFGREEGTVYAAMELLEGETLRQRLQEGALPPRKAVEIAVEMASGLAAAHDRGIVHPDLKPENVILVRSVQVNKHRVYEWLAAETPKWKLSPDSPIVGMNRQWKRAERKKLWHKYAANNVQIAAHLKAARDLEGPDAVRFKHRLIVHNYSQIVKHAQRLEAGLPLTSGYRYVRADARIAHDFDYWKRLDETSDMTFEELKLLE